VNAGGPYYAPHAGRHGASASILNRKYSCPKRLRGHSGNRQILHLPLLSSLIRAARSTHKSIVGHRILAVSVHKRNAPPIRSGQGRSEAEPKGCLDGEDEYPRIGLEKMRRAFSSAFFSSLD